MKVSPINYQTGTNNTNFGANLWVDKSVEKVVDSNKDNFAKAARDFGNWLKHDKWNVPMTLTIRKNTSLFPNVALERVETKTTYAYPHEENGYTYQDLVKKYEDLEFELGNRKCGFWFDPASGQSKLVEDFKNMFNFLHKGQ